MPSQKCFLIGKMVNSGVFCVVILMYIHNNQ